MNHTSINEPIIRDSQLSNDSIGDIQKSVNLYRGDVNFNLSLLSLVGINNLNVDLSLFYGSDAKQEINTWNMDAPTGISGLGWFFPFESIFVDNHGADTAAEQSFYIKTGGTTIPLIQEKRTGNDVFFQMQEERFWEIFYSPGSSGLEQQKWVITKEDGKVYTYGTTDGIQWGVKWDTWIGSTTNGSSKRYPIAWNLIKIEDKWGNEIQFEYEYDNIAIGSNESSYYTQSCRIKSIIDTLNNKVVFEYKEKENFEIQFPEEIPRSTDSNAFQFNYETKFLDKIEVSNEQSVLLSTTRFTYSFFNLADYPNNSNDNYKKRYLESVFQENTYGIELPKYSFSYYDDRTEINSGAIKQITYPSGKTAYYEYEAHELASSRNDLSVDIGRGKIPRVWHGSNFVVISQYDDQSKELTISTYSWNGTFVKWEYEQVFKNVEDDSVIITASSDFFTLHYKIENKETIQFYAFRNNKRAFGNWKKTFDLQIEKSNSFAVTTGINFFAFVKDNRLNFYIWNQANQEWAESTKSISNGAYNMLACAYNFVLSANYNQNSEALTVKLFFLDEYGRWTLGSDYTQTIKIDKEYNEGYISNLLAIGESWCTLTYVTDQKGEEVYYERILLPWDQDFNFKRETKKEYTQNVEIDNPLHFTVAREDILEQGQYLSRFNGKTWITDEFPVKGDGEYRYTIGSDIAIQLVKKDNNQNYNFRQYNPYKDDWSSDRDFDGEEVKDEDTFYFPTVSYKYMTIGHKIYYRNSKLIWEYIGQLPSSADLSTLYNLAPNYLVYQTKGGETQVLFVENGLLLKTKTDNLLNQKFSTPLKEFKAGKILAGPSTLVTYDGEDLDTTKKLHIYLIKNHVIAKRQTVVSVSQLTINDGYKSYPTFYKYNAATATFDTNYKIVQYAEVNVYPIDKSGKYGYTKYKFYNGLSTNVDSSKYNNVNANYTLLAGQLYEESKYAFQHKLLSQVKHDFWIYTQKIGGLNTRILGNYARVTRSKSIQVLFAFDLNKDFENTLNDSVFSDQLQTVFAGKGFDLDHPTITTSNSPRSWTIEDGRKDLNFRIYEENSVLKVYLNFTSTVLFEYNDKGQEGRVQTTNWNSKGTEEILLKKTTYAWEIPQYKELKDHNELTAIAEQTENCNDKIVSKKVSTYSNALSKEKHWHLDSSYTWKGDLEEVEFPYEIIAETGDNTVQGWVKEAEVTVVNNKGITNEVLDQEEKVSSIIFDANESLPVAEFVNASIAHEEASYYGFEPYENSGIWEIYPNTAPVNNYITSQEAFTGTQCLVLTGKASNQGIKGFLSPNNGKQFFLVRAWFKQEPITPSTIGFTGCVIVVTGHSGQRKEMEVPFDCVNKEWNYFQYPIKPSETGIDDIKSLEISFYNQQVNTELLLDNLCIQPLLSEVAITVYDPAFKLSTAKINSYNVVERYTYDLYQNVIETSVNQVPQSISTFWNWKQSDSDFNKSLPSHQLNISSKTGGFTEIFTHGDAWKNQWNPSGDWQVKQSTLACNGTGTLSLKEPIKETNIGLCFGLDTAFLKDFSIQMKGIFEIAFKDNLWELKGNEISSVTSKKTGNDFILIKTENILLFYIDGQQVFNAIFDTTKNSDLELGCTESVQLNYLSLFKDPIIGITYQDNGGKTLQDQLQNGADVQCKAKLYDDLGKEAITTKTAFLPNTYLSYQEDFVTHMDWQTGILTGRLANEYPEDHGYPYSRTHFDNTLSSLVSEQGIPGKDFNINLEIPVTDRHTTFNEIGVNTAIEGIDLPAGKYISKTLINPDKTQLVEISDLRGNLIVSLTHSPDIISDTNTLTKNDYDDSGNLVQVFQPNYFDLRVSGHDEFIEEYTYDFLGRLTSKSLPDTSTATQYIYDQVGRIRFLQDANGKEENYFLYWVYDNIGRLVEKGYAYTAWDENTLQALANKKEAYPTNAQWMNRYTYDKDDQLPEFCGRLWKVESRNSEEDKGTKVFDQFEYDTLGRVTRKGLCVPEFDEQEYQIDYQYDNLGNVTEMVYNADQSSDQFKAYYAYNDIGQHQGIKTLKGDTKVTELATYEYTANGMLKQEVLSANGNDSLLRKYNYNSPGWLKSIIDPHFTEILQYTEGGYQDKGYYAGNIASAAYEIKGINAQGNFTTAYKYKYAYDALGRLSTAQNNINEAWSLGINNILSYDTNGNRKNVQQGAVLETFEYQQGSNQLINTLGDETKSYAYNPNGSITTAAPIGVSDIKYSKIAQLTTKLIKEVSGIQSTFEFTYNGSNTRVLKKGNGTTKLYVPSIDGQPILEITKSESAVIATDYLLYGVTGLFAIHHKEQELVSILLKDHLNSTRLVWDGSEIIEAFNYLPYGGFMGDVYQKTTEKPLSVYLYTGQEYDAFIGLYNYKARLYDPTTGQFYSCDPAMEFYSPYLYVGNNPISFNDPSGMVVSAAAGSIIAAGTAAIPYVAAAAVIGLVFWGIFGHHGNGEPQQQQAIPQFNENTSPRQYGVVPQQEQAQQPSQQIQSQEATQTQSFQQSSPPFDLIRTMLSGQYDYIRRYVIENRSSMLLYYGIGTYASITLNRFNHIHNVNQEIPLRNFERYRPILNLLPPFQLLTHMNGFRIAPWYLRPVFFGPLFWTAYKTVNFAYRFNQRKKKE